MASCNLCPPGSRDVPDAEMPDHLRAVHPEVAIDGTGAADDSTIVPEVPAEPGPPGEGEWRS